MEKKQKKWRSPSLGKTMTLLEYGTSGTPILALPTRGKACSQWEAHGMTDAISYQLNNGFNRLYCIDSVDEETFLNKKVDPVKRLKRHQQFELYVMEEVVPFILEAGTIKFLIIAGIDMGGYHAIALALKYPKKFGRAIGITGIYDIKPFMDDFYDNAVYYNNPVDFLPNLTKPLLLKDIQEVDFRLVSYAEDEHKEETVRLGDIFRTKFLDHKVDIWDKHEEDEWKLRQQMLKTHIL